MEERVNDLYDKEPSNDPTKSVRILVAEDNEINRMMLISMLEKKGYEATIAANGLEVLNALTSKAFDLVLMDMMMPEMDGLEAMAIIRDKEKMTGEHLPIVAMSALATPGDIKRYLEAGADACLGKPFSSKDLFDFVNRFLSEENSAATLPSAMSDPRRMMGEPIPAFNLDEALSRVDGDKTLLRELIEMFFAGLSRHLENIEQGIKNGDPVTVSFSAHSLKGAAGNLSAMALCEAAFQLERACQFDDLGNVEDVYQKLNDEIQRFRAVSSLI